jgi:hypothetical protein
MLVLVFSFPCFFVPVKSTPTTKLNYTGEII